ARRLPRVLAAGAEEAGDPRARIFLRSQPAEVAHVRIQRAAPDIDSHSERPDAALLEPERVSARPARRQVLGGADVARPRSQSDEVAELLARQPRDASAD